MLIDEKVGSWDVLLRHLRGKVQSTKSDVLDFTLIAHVGKLEYKIILQNIRSKT